MMRFSRVAVRVAPLAGIRYSSSVTDELKQTLIKKRDVLNEKIKLLKEKAGTGHLSDSTVDKCYGGMRDIIGLVYEPSLLDKDEGIRFRGLSIPECQKMLPNNAPNGQEPLAEGMFWLLLTGDVPTKEQVTALNAELQKRADPAALEGVKKVLDAMPQKVHPMTQLSTGILALQQHSVFAQQYAAGKANKNNYWELALEDTLNCVARVPSVAAMIYRRFTTGKSDLPCAVDPKLDWSANFARQLGFNQPDFWDCMRLYLSIHVDHEGGNVSAHTTTLVASALSDPYLALSAGMNGLAGPLHGLANQEVLAFLMEMKAHFKAHNVDMKDKPALSKAIEKYTWEEVLNKKRVVPGYGHAVLRKTDPRYTCQREFCLRNFPNDELFVLVDTIYSVMPDILTKHGKTKNPYPNVDSHSGVLLQHYGLKEQDYYTVLFGVSRQLGVLSAVVWDRLTNRPIERPKSVTTEWLCHKFHVCQNQQS